MANPFKRGSEHRIPVIKPAMFETRSDEWERVGLKMEVSRSELRNARGRLILEILALIATIIGKSWSLHKYETTPHYNFDKAGKVLNPSGNPHYWLIHSKSPFEIAAVIIVLGLGWMISRDLSRIAPTLFRRMDPATAGTVQFVIRLLAVAITILGAINIAGVSAQVIAVGGAFTAVVVGLAAQPLLTNLFSGMVLLTAQPFKLGQRVRLQSGTIQIQEGTISSLGLLYTTMNRGTSSRIMIPNSLVLAAVVVPLREPAPVDVRVKLNQGVRPSQAQAILDSELSDDTLGKTSVSLEEIDGDDVYIRVSATPEDGDESARLADEIIKVLASVTGEHTAVGDGVPDHFGAEHPSVPDPRRRR